MMHGMDEAAAAATDLLKALASPNRLKILCHLIDGEKSVGGIAALLGVRETVVSQHLALLRKDRLVRSRRSGQTIFYAIDSPQAEQVLRVLHQLYCHDHAASGPTDAASPPDQAYVTSPPDELDEGGASAERVAACSSPG